MFDADGKDVSDCGGDKSGAPVDDSHLRSQHPLPTMRVSSVELPAQLMFQIDCIPSQHLPTKPRPQIRSTE